jgi:hypothetical protein
LNRFAYKNPKKFLQGETKFKRPTPKAEEPINLVAAKMIENNEIEESPDKLFFHKYFIEKNNLINSGRSKEKIKSSVANDNDEGNIEDEMDQFADQLAEGLMQDNGDSDDDILPPNDSIETFNGRVSDVLDFDEFTKIKKWGETTQEESDDEDDSDVDFDEQAKDDQSDTDEENYQLTAFGDEDEDETLESEVKSPGKLSKKIIKKPQEKKKKEKHTSDFAAAEDYEEDMESIIKQLQDYHEQEAKQNKLHTIAGKKRNSEDDEIYQEPTNKKKTKKSKKAPTK